jgi:hypothetical protein
MQNRKIHADPSKIKFVSIEDVDHDMSGWLSFSMLLDYFNIFLD